MTNNEPAFPLGNAMGGYKGMTLRDWFAGQALVGLLAHASGETPEKCATYAYPIADLVMLERQKGQP